jgi:hypothetical protein
MTLSQIALAFIALCAILTAFTFLDWPAILSTADTFAVQLAGLLVPLWEPVESLFLQ